MCGKGISDTGYAKIRCRDSVSGGFGVGISRVSDVSHRALPQPIAQSADWRKTVTFVVIQNFQAGFSLIFFAYGLWQI